MLLNFPYVCVYLFHYKYLFVDNNENIYFDEDNTLFSKSCTYLDDKILLQFWLVIRFFHSG
jgi:hypothetical protein